MKHITLPLAAAITIVAAPAIAQDSPVPMNVVPAADAVEDAAGEAATATAEAVAAPKQQAVDMPRIAREPRVQDPRITNYRFIKPVDYPIAAWQADEEGAVGYTVEVSADGKALSCKVTRSSGSQHLDGATCPLVMERAEFRPGMDEKGEAVAGTFESQQSWRKREPEVPQMAFTFRYLHGADGKSIDCEFLRMENLPERMRKDIERDLERGTLCTGSGFGNNRGIPYRDENGIPVAKRVTITFDAQLDDPVEVTEQAPE